MCVGFSIDQLGTDTYLVARPLDAPLQHIAHSQLPTDLLCVSRPVPIGERGIARDHEHVCEPRQIGRQILGNAVGKILLFAVVAQIDERQDHNRQTWSSGWSGTRNLLIYWTLAPSAAPANLARELVASTSDRAD